MPWQRMYLGVSRMIQVYFLSFRNLIFTAVCAEICSRAVECLEGNRGGGGGVCACATLPMISASGKSRFGGQVGGSGGTPHPAFLRLRYRWTDDQYHYHNETKFGSTSLTYRSLLADLGLWRSPIHPSYLACGTDCHKLRARVMCSDILRFEAPRFRVGLIRWIAI